MYFSSSFPFFAVKCMYIYIIVIAITTTTLYNNYRCCCCCCCWLCHDFSLFDIPFGICQAVCLCQAQLSFPSVNLIHICFVCLCRVFIYICPFRMNQLVFHIYTIAMVATACNISKCQHNKKKKNECLQSMRA